MLLLVVARPRMSDRRRVREGDGDREVGDALGDGVTSISPAVVGLHGESMSWVEEGALPSKVELEMALRSTAIGLVFDVWGMLDRFPVSDIRVEWSSAGSLFFPSRPEGDVGLDRGGEGGRI